MYTDTMAGKGGSPTFSPHRLERPEERLHARRPSDESEQIIRMSNLLHLPNKPPPIPIPMPCNFFMSDNNNNNRFDYNNPGMSRSSSTGIGLGETGRVMAFSDSFLHADMEDGPPMGEMSPRPLGGIEDYRVFSPENQLFPPLSITDRHPSAPQLASILTSQVNKTENMIQMDSMVEHRPRSSSMPGYQRRVPLAPQISISSPDEMAGENILSSVGVCGLWPLPGPSLTT